MKSKLHEDANCGLTHTSAFHYRAYFSSDLKKLYIDIIFKDCSILNHIIYLHRILEGLQNIMIEIYWAEPFLLYSHPVGYAFKILWPRFNVSSDFFYLLQGKSEIKWLHYIEPPRFSYYSHIIAIIIKCKSKLMFLRVIYSFITSDILS